MAKVKVVYYPAAERRGSFEDTTRKVIICAEPVIFRQENGDGPLTNDSYWYLRAGETEFSSRNAKLKYLEIDGEVLFSRRER